MKRRNSRITIILIILLILLMAGTSFALYSVILKGKNTSGIEINEVSFIYTENSDNVVNMTRMTKESGKNQDTYFDFSITVKSKGEAKLKYYIYLEEEKNNNIAPNLVNVYLTDQENNPLGRFKENNADLKLTTLDNKYEGLNNVVDTGCYKIKNNNLYSCDTNNQISNPQNLRLRFWSDEITERNANVIDKNNEHTAIYEKLTFKFKLNIKVEEIK